MARRLLTAAVGLPVLALVVLSGEPWHFSVLLLVVSGVALLEYYAVAFPGQWGLQSLGLALGLSPAVALVTGGPALASALVAAALFALVFFLRGQVRGLPWGLFGLFYLGVLLPHFALLDRLPNGREWILWLLLAIMAGDSAAYFVGRSLGRRKLAARISPNKTVEGSLGHVAATMVAGYAASFFLLEKLAVSEVLALALAASLLGQAGDLFESWLKRRFSVKDSGWILPGHGGLLDRVDSLILPAVFATYYVKLVHS
jgi:phosphatidate cytidylyltransferase